MSRAFLIKRAHLCRRLILLREANAIGYTSMYKGKCEKWEEEDFASVALYGTNQEVEQTIKEIEWTLFKDAKIDAETVGIYKTIKNPNRILSTPKEKELREPAVYMTVDSIKLRLELINATDIFTFTHTTLYGRQWNEEESYKAALYATDEHIKALIREITRICQENNHPYTPLKFKHQRETHVSAT